MRAIRHTEILRVLRVILLLGACLHLTGGHYGVLQCVAWAGMLWNYTEEGGLLEGAEKTFSGESPCCLCEAITAAKEQESRQQEKLPPGGMDKFSLKDLKCPELVRLEPPAAVLCAGLSYLAPDGFKGLWMESPALPPPRVAG